MRSRSMSPAGASSSGLRIVLPCQEGLMRIVRLGEMMHARAVVKRVIVVIRIGRVQCRGNTRQAGVGDRSGGQTRAVIGVVRAVDLRVLIGQRAVDAAERIDDRRVDVQVRIVCGIAQAVIDNGAVVLLSLAWRLSPSSIMEATVTRS